MHRPTPPRAIRTAAPLTLLALVAAFGAHGVRADGATRADPATLEGRPEATGLARTGFIAEHVVRDPEDGLIRQLTRVEFSVHGRRITQIGGAGERLVVNDDLQRLWMVDRRRRVVHEVPLVRSVDGASSSATDVAATPAARPGNVFDLALCTHADVTDPGDATWRGRAVVRADCAGADGEVLSVQSFDPDAGVVVRVERADGTVEELRGIEELAFGPDHFVPSASLREVSIEELLGGAAPVARYAER